MQCTPDAHSIPATSTNRAGASHASNGADISGSGSRFENSVLGAFTHRLPTLAAVAVTVATLAGCGGATDAASTSRPAPAVATAAPIEAKTPAPTTVAGFQAMFDKVSVNEWGGGDVSVSVEIADGRTVWLYGDTVSKRHGMVNSTALVQDGGVLHVSQGGAQLLPEGRSQGGRRTVYWIETARALGGNKVEVTAAHMSIGTRDAWDFERASVKSRTATLTVDKVGDVRFDGWTGYVPEPQVDKTLLGPAQGVPADRYADKGAVFYRANTHPQVTLDSGKSLVTICTNRTDGDLTDLKAYRPIFIQR